MLVRPSGTEPVIRVMSEAVNEQDAKEKVDYVVGAMAASGHLIEIKK